MLLTLHNLDLMKAALKGPLDPKLHALLADRIQDTIDCDLTELTHIVVASMEAEIVAETTFSPLVNPIDGKRWPNPGFIPGWDWLERHEGFFELIVTVGDSGFAYILIIPDADETEADLLDMCRHFAGEPA